MAGRGARATTVTTGYAWVTLAPHRRRADLDTFASVSVAGGLCSVAWRLQGRCAVCAPAMSVAIDSAGAQRQRSCRPCPMTSISYAAVTAVDTLCSGTFLRRTKV